MPVEGGVVRGGKQDSDCQDCRGPGSLVSQMISLSLDSWAQIPSVITNRIGRDIRECETK